MWVGAVNFFSTLPTVRPREVFQVTRSPTASFFARFFIGQLRSVGAAINWGTLSARCEIRDERTRQRQRIAA